MRTGSERIDADRDGKNRIPFAAVRRTYTRMNMYNTGMENKQPRKIKRSWIDTSETVTVIGGFLLALLLSRVRIHGAHMPFALGLLLACALSEVEAYAVVGGIALGAVIDTPPQWHTMLAAILFFGAVRVVVWSKRHASVKLYLLLFAASCTASLPVAALTGWIELLYGIIASVLAAAFGVCAHRAMRSVRKFSIERYFNDTEQTMCVLVIGVLLLALSELELFGWSASVSILLLATELYVSVRGLFGAAAGTLWASLFVLYTGGDPLSIGVVAIGALSSTAVRREGKPFIVLPFFCAALLFQTILSESASAVNLQNLLFGSLLYLLIPKDWIAQLKAWTDAYSQTERSMKTAIAQIEYGASNELMRMGKLLSSFSGMFRTALQEDDAVKRWTMQGALTVCRGCSAKDVCWKDAYAMQDAVVQIADDAAQGRTAKVIDPIDPDCGRFRDLCAAALLSYQQAQNRNAVCERVKEQTGLIDRQFVGAGETLCGYASRMRERDRETDPMCSRIRTALKEAGVRVVSVDRYRSDGTETVSVCVLRPLAIKRVQLLETLHIACGFRLRIVESEIERDTVTMLFERDSILHASMRVSQMCDAQTVSGDATGECRLLGGHVCFALSDGMGRGKSAREESEAAIDLLFRLYHAGMRRELIYENVNRMLLARNDTEMYATLDAVSIDLNTGEAELLKYGAPPSFLLRNGKVKPIFGQALPCGILAEAKPSVIRLKLKPNDRLVLCSDGVQDVLREGPENAIRSVSGAYEAMGDRLLALAKKEGSADDMTVMVIRVA